MNAYIGRGVCMYVCMTGAVTEYTVNLVRHVLGKL